MKITIALYSKEHKQLEGLKFLLDREFDVVASYSTPDRFKEVIRAHPTDVVLMGLCTIDDGAIELIKKVKSLATRTKVIVITDSAHKEDILSTARAGIDGYLLQHTTASKLITAVREVVEGGAPMSPEISRKAIELCASIHETSLVINKDSLTSRELEVLRYLIGGLSYKLVSDQLNISIDTTRGHIRNLYRKLQVNSKAEAVAKALGTQHMGLN